MQEEEATAANPSIELKEPEEISIEVQV